MKRLPLQSFRLRNFKAVRDSGVIRFTPLTVFIGNNGSGKSSILEGLETFQRIAEQNLDHAMRVWREFEHVWHKGVSHELLEDGQDRPCHSHPMGFHLRGRVPAGRLSSQAKVGGAFTADLEVNLGPGGNELFIQRERVVIKGQVTAERDRRGHVVTVPAVHPLSLFPFPDGESILGRALDGFVFEWQFLSLIPQAMGVAVPQTRTGGRVWLAKDGSNIAEYLLEIRQLDRQAFDGILESVQYVLPYASDLQPTLTSELERAVYLQMTEGTFKVPGWLLSTGTLRLVALLAVLRHPSPPPLLCVEEIENGLDPRTLHLLVEEIRATLEAGSTQIILTTHSPYLLDLLSLSQLVLVERVDGQPRFSRPGDQESLKHWAKDFAPGQLYTMGRLSSRAHP